MTSSDPSLRWDQIRHFVAVAEAGSLVGAARRLGVGHATVLRNVARLEARLGVRLFDHVRSGYRLTADGADLLPSAQAMEEHAETLLRRAMGRNPSPEGVLKLVVEDGSLFDPMPLLQRFQAAHRGIELALEDATGAADARIAQLQADAAVVVTGAPPEDLVGRRLKRLPFGYFAAADYLDGRPSESLAPEHCAWILWGQPGALGLDDGWQHAAMRRLTRRPRLALRADRHAEALAATRAGVGVALLSVESAGGLVRLPFAEPPQAVGVWLLTHPDLRHSGRVRALFDFVAAQAFDADAGNAPSPPR